MLLLPIGDDEKATRITYVNYAIVLLNVLVYLLFTYRLNILELNKFAREWGTIPSNFRFHTLVTSAFVHAGFFHLLGNMWFLSVFGDNIENRMGHIAYFFFYLGGAACADLVFVVLNSGSNIPVVGASGAVSAVLGAYIVMLPKVKVKILWWAYYRAGIFSISSMYAIGFWVAMQLFFFFVIENENLGGVAYSAHLAGFAFGIVSGLIAGSILKSIRSRQMKILESFKKDAASVNIAAEGGPGSPYARDAAKKQQEFERAARSGLRKPVPLTRNYVSDIQENISNLLAMNRTDLAVNEYLSFIRKFRFAALPAMDQLRMADLFLTRQEYRLAQEAYERFLRHYPHNAHANDVRYNLAMVCAEYTQDFSSARKHLKILQKTTGDSVKKVEIENELKRIEEHYAKTYSEQAGVEQGTDESGLFAVFRQTGGIINIPEVGRIIAAMQKLPLADVTSRLFTCSGFLAESLTRQQADMLARDLQQMKIPVFLVRQEKVRALPEVILAEDATFTTDGFTARIDGQDETIPWPSILMINAGAIESSRNREVIGGDGDDIKSARSAFGFGPRKKKSVIVRETQKRTVIDILLKEPWQRFRIQEGYTVFAMLGERRQPTTEQNMEHLAQEALRHAGDTFIGEGLSALAAHSSMPDHTYENRRKYNLVNFWFAHRALFDRPS